MGLVKPSGCVIRMTGFLHWCFFFTVLVYDRAPIVGSKTTNNDFAVADNSFRASIFFRGRTLSDTTVTTPDCGAIRVAPYAAELQLLYEYSVEFKPGRAVSLTDLERAVASVVAIQLDTCDSFGRPMYKVKTQAQHKFTDKVCIPKADVRNGCIVVKGQTVILLDDYSTFVKTKVYEAIENGLSHPDLLDGYTDSVVKTTYLSRGKALLVDAGQVSEDANDADSHISPITATIAVAAASVSFVVASIFCYGFMRREAQQPHHEPSVRHKSHSRKPTIRTIVPDSLGVRPRRQFVRLEDLSASPTSFVTANATPVSRGGVYDYAAEKKQADNANIIYTPSIMWSVSDITSDSSSLRSGFSRSPSMLERIEEEEEDWNEYEGESFGGSHDGKESLCETRGENIRSGRSSRNHNVEDFDCQSQGQNKMLDLSDLDPCFSIADLSDVHNDQGGKGSLDAGQDITLDVDPPCLDHASGTLSTLSDNDAQGNLAENSESDFSEISMIVVAVADKKVSERREELAECLHETKIKPDDEDAKSLDYSLRTSCEDMKNCEVLQSTLPADTLFKSEEEGARTSARDVIFEKQSENSSFVRKDVTNDVQERIHKRGKELLSVSTDKLNDFLPDPTDAQEPDESHTVSVHNIEDSIEEWVSELMGQQPNDA